MRQIRNLHQLGVALLGLAGVVAAVLGATHHNSYALVALGIAVLVLAVALGALAVDVLGVLESAAQQADGRAQRQEKALRQQSRRLDRVLFRLQRVERLKQQLEAVPSQTANLARMQDALLDDQRPMPTLGGWAATAPTIELLVETVLRSDRDPVVLECGSGASTVWVAAALRRRGGGHVTSLDHEPVYAEKTRDALRLHGVAAYATVVDAPLAPLPGDEDGRLWYAVDALPRDLAVDVLFVDGPPALSWDQARLPAWERLAGLLGDGAVVVLDDTDRDEEKAIVERWTATPVAGRRLSVVERVGRATLLRVSLEG